MYERNSHVQSMLQNKAIIKVHSKQVTKITANQGIDAFERLWFKSIS